jgi:hypothetical protein
MDQNLAEAAMAQSNLANLGPVERVLDPRSEWAHTAETASGDCGLYRPASTTGITRKVDFFLAIFLSADAGWVAVILSHFFYRGRHDYMRRGQPKELP